MWVDGGIIHWNNENRRRKRFEDNDFSLWFGGIGAHVRGTESTFLVNSWTCWFGDQERGLGTSVHTGELLAYRWWLEPWIRRWKGYRLKAGKAACGDVIKGLEWPMKVLQGETVLAKEIVQVGVELKSNSLSKHVWSMFCVAWHGWGGEQKRQSLFCPYAAYQLRLENHVCSNFHNNKYYKREVLRAL